jgi:alpha-amylase
VWKVLFGASLTCILVILLTVEPSGKPEVVVPKEQSSTLPRTTFVHLFEWKWDDIAQECDSFLGPRGFAAVQISPPNEHAVIPEQGFPWWQRYQPVSYELVSRSGDRTQLTHMINRCHEAGVEVYVDAVINHMAAEESGTGSAGTRFTKYHYPGLYQRKDFHTCRHPIDYNDRDTVINCELVGLPDLNTGSTYVRDRIVEYLADLVSLKVDGFRVDAAKHIHTNDVNAIVRSLNSKVDPDPYIFQEVLDPGYEAVKKSEYYQNGDVIEAEYGRYLGEAFLGINGRNLSQLKTLGESWGLAPSDQSIVFVDNHDKQRGHGGGGNYLTYKDGTLYDLANIFMLAFPYGYPMVMSSYEFSHPDQGPPSDAHGQTRSIYRQGQLTCFREWKCEHRRQAIANMVGFRNYTASIFELTDWWNSDRNQIAFGRGYKGFVVLNRDAEPLTQRFKTSLPPGTYCNIIQSNLTRNGQACTVAEAEITVNQHGQFTATVEAMGAIAIYGGAKLK